MDNTPSECPKCKPGFYTFAAVETHVHDNKGVPCEPGCFVTLRCYLCGTDPVAYKARRGRANRNRRERHAAMTSLGLVRVKGALGGTYYE